MHDAIDLLLWAVTLSAIAILGDVVNLWDVVSWV